MMILNFLFQFAFAYIPPADFILHRTADTALRSPVAIEYEITIQTPTASTVLQEQWYIEGPQRMRMKLAKGGDLEIVYNNSERSFLDRQGRKTQKVSPEFVEKIAFLESSASLRRMMHELTIPSSVQTATPVLSRADGVVNYGFFQRTTDQLQVLNPGVWIEQDQFIIRQIRFKSGAQLNLADYRSYAKTTLLPFQKTIRWKSYQANIKVLRMIEKKKFNPLELTTLDTTLDFGSMDPDAKQAVLEFYSRFR